METMKNILIWIKDKTVVAAKWLYKEFRQYPQYGWPTVAFIAGYITAKFI